MEKAKIRFLGEENHRGILQQAWRTSLFASLKHTERRTTRFCTQKIKGAGSKGFSCRGSECNLMMEKLHQWSLGLALAEHTMETGSAWQGTAEKGGTKQPSAPPHLNTNSKLFEGPSWALRSQICFKAVPRTHLAVVTWRRSEHFPTQIATGTGLAGATMRVQHCPALCACAMDEPTQETSPEKGRRVSLGFQHL